MLALEMYIEHKIRIGGCTCVMGSVAIVTYESDKIMTVTLVYFILLAIYHAYSSRFEWHRCIPFFTPRNH